jgi:hypothetical protein
MDAFFFQVDLERRMDLNLRRNFASCPEQFFLNKKVTRGNVINELADLPSPENKALERAGWPHLFSRRGPGWGINSRCCASRASVAGHACGPFNGRKRHRVESPIRDFYFKISSSPPPVFTLDSASQIQCIVFQSVNDHITFPHLSSEGNFWSALFDGVYELKCSLSVDLCVNEFF